MAPLKPGALSDLSVGRFVWTGDRFAIGKLIALNDVSCTVRITYSVNSSEKRDYNRDQLRRAYLSPQTRVYVDDRASSGDSADFRIGRITDYRIIEPDVFEYQVRFVNGDWDWMAEERLEVRCLQPKVDPTDVLASGGIESQFLHDRRLSALQALANARSLGGGLTGLLSSSIVLVPHQIDVVQRVLEDPVQRYLLADEVGMGKTIEAGAILRQNLIDGSVRSALILVPPSLVRQWQSELERRFHLDDFDVQVEILAFEDLPAAAERNYDFLIVDEAHNLVGPSPSSTPAFKRLVNLAHSTTRVLLLSATPLIGNEEPTLALLHLLDPASHPLSERTRFEQMLTKRQEYGQILLSLDPSASPIILRRIGRRLVDTFPDDNLVCELASHLVSDGSDQVEDALPKVVEALRIHISETYRLHQRLIRSRRRDAEEWMFLPREGAAVVDADLDERVASLCDILEDWRYNSRNGPVPGSDELTVAFSRRYSRLFDALGQGAEAFEAELEDQWIQAQVGDLPTFEEEARIVNAVREILCAPPEETHLDAAITMARLTFSALGGLGVRDSKIVAFTSSSTFAASLSAELVKMADVGVLALVSTEDSEDLEEDIQRFRTDAGSGVIVCDRSGEEGHNFHFADAIIHFDLPLSVERLEQRVGRVDRFGRTEPKIMQRILVPSDNDDSPWIAWFELLRDGFRLFNESLSEVQFVLANLIEEIRLSLYLAGAQGIRAMTDSIKERLLQERHRLDEQYALDRLAMARDEAILLREDLELLDESEGAFEKAVDPWLKQVLGLKSQEADDDEIFELFWTRRTLVPENPWKDMLKSGLEVPATYKRAVAVRKPRTRLFRPGLPMIDALGDFMRWEDRGAVFATWRLDPAWGSAAKADWVGFRLVYVVEPNHQLVEQAIIDFVATVMLPSVRRRTESLVHPWLETMYMNADLHEEHDPEVLLALQRPYEKSIDNNGRCDFNLGSRKDALFSLFDRQVFEQLCQSIRRTSEKELRSGEKFRRKLREVASRAQRVLSVRNARLRLRAEAELREFGVTDKRIDVERLLNDAIGRVVEDPAIRLDSIGFFVVSDKPPPDFESRT